MLYVTDVITVYPNQKVSDIVIKQLQDRLPSQTNTVIITAVPYVSDPPLFIARLSFTSCQPNSLIWPLSLLQANANWCLHITLNRLILETLTFALMVTNQ